MLLLSLPAYAQEKFNLFNRAAAPGCATGDMIYVSATPNLGCQTPGTAGNATGWVKLQTSYPGTQQTGSFNVSGDVGFGGYTSTSAVAGGTAWQELYTSALGNFYTKIIGKSGDATNQWNQWVTGNNTSHPNMMGWYPDTTNRGDGIYLVHNTGSPNQAGLCILTDSGSTLSGTIGNPVSCAGALNVGAGNNGFLVDNTGAIQYINGHLFGTWPTKVNSACLRTTSLGAMTWDTTCGTGPTGGSVTSVNGSGGTTGLTVTGGPITSSGTLTLGGTLGIANGGTNGTTRTAGFNNLAPASAAKGDILAFDGTDWVRLAVGTNGYALFADSTQTAGVKWAAVAGTGTVTSISTTAPVTGCSSPCTVTATIGISTFAGSTPGAVPDATGAGAGTYLDKSGNWTQPSGSFTSPLTTKGDLHTYSTGDTRLGVGTDGQVPMADSAQTVGLSYQWPGYGTMRVLKETVFAGITPTGYTNGNTYTIDGSGYTCTVAGNGAVDMVAAGLRLRQGTTSSTNFQIMKIAGGNTGDFASFFTDERFRRGRVWAWWLRIASYDYTNASGNVFGFVEFSAPGSAKWGVRFGRNKNLNGSPNTATGGLSYDWWWNGSVANASTYSSIGVSSNDVLVVVYRTPTLIDVYTGTYSAGWPALSALTKAGTIFPAAASTFISAANGGMDATNMAITFLLGASAASSSTYEIVFDRWRVTTWE